MLILLTIYRVNKQKITSLDGRGIKSTAPIFKSEMFIYRSTANLDENILFLINH